MPGIVRMRRRRDARTADDLQAELLEGLDAVQWRVWIALLIGQSNLNGGHCAHKSRDALRAHRYFEAGLDEVRVLPYSISRCGQHVQRRDSSWN